MLQTTTALTVLSCAFLVETLHVLQLVTKYVYPITMAPTVTHSVKQEITQWGTTLVMVMGTGSVWQATQTLPLSAPSVCQRMDAVSKL